MKRVWIIAFLLVLALPLLLAGCAPKPAGLVGKWTGTATTGGAEYPMTMVFNADGTTHETGGGPMGAVDNQLTWKADGATLTEVAVSSVFNGAVVKVSDSPLSPETYTYHYAYKIENSTLNLDFQGAMPMKAVLKRED